MPPSARLADPTPQQLFDLCMLGLAWLREDNPSVVDRTGNGVLQTMRSAGTHSTMVQNGVVTNYGMVKLADHHGQDHMTDVRPAKSELDELIAASDKLFLYLRYPPALLNRTRIFGPHGYPLVITRAGVAYAEALAPAYAHVITSGAFIAAWRRHARAMRAMHGDGTQ